MKKNKTARVSSSKLRQILNEFTEQVCRAQKRSIGLELSDRTISISLEIGTINITMNEPLKGGSHARV